MKKALILSLSLLPTIGFGYDGPYVSISNIRSDKFEKAIGAVRDIKRDVGILSGHDIVAKYKNRKIYITLPDSELNYETRKFVQALQSEFGPALNIKNVDINDLHVGTQDDAMTQYN